MAEPGHDQQAQSWSRGAEGYVRRFEGFTGLYADAALALLGVTDGTSVLDVACGSGVVTAAALDRGAHVVATDFAEGMLAELVLRRRRADGSTPPVARMDAQQLAVADASVEVAVSMFGVMFAPDIPAAIGEMARSVWAGGRVGVGSWSLDSFPLGALVAMAVRRTIPDFQGRYDPPWAPVGSEQGLGDALRGAGLVDVEVQAVRRWWRFTDPDGFFREAPTWSPPLQPLFDSLNPDQIDRAAGHFADVVAEVAEADGVPNDALIAVGRAR